MTQADDDIQLMLRVRDGDRDAFEELVGRYQRSAVSTAYRFLGDSAQAQDIAQEAFLRLFRARERYEPTASFSTFFYRILSNLCYSALRRRRPGVSLEQTRGDLGGSMRDALVDENAPAPEGRLEEQELKSAVREALEGLPENQRMALVLFRFQGLCYRDIAATMDTTEKAVKSLLARARAALRDKLARYVE